MSNVVLIPGAGGTAWYWSRTVDALRARGIEAIAVDLPGDDPAAGLPEYADLVVAAAGDREPPLVVAQSMGGFTAPLVWSRIPVRGVVFVNAMVPEPGERAGEWWDNVGAVSARVDAAVAGGYSTEFDLETYFLHDVAPELAAEGEPYQRNEDDRAFGDVCDFAWPAVPVDVVAGRDDRFFPLDLQRRVARDRLAHEVDVLPGGHLMAVSRPDELADYLAARA